MQWLTCCAEMLMPQELQKFAGYIVRGFFELAAKNPLLFAELLVWKTSGECYELVEGYGAREKDKERMKNRTVWSREQEAELAELFHRFRSEDGKCGSCSLRVLDSCFFSSWVKNRCGWMH